MEVLIIILCFSCYIMGLVGSIVPAVPAPLSYIAILILSLFTSYHFANDFLVMWAGIVITVTALDYWLQVYGVKKFGGKQKLSMEHLSVNFRYTIPIPFGFIIGPFIGAFVGAYLEEKDDLTKSFIIALGALAGFLSGTILKLAVSLYLTYEFIIVLLNV